MARVLLPNTRLGTADKSADWAAGASTTGIFSISAQKAKENLIWHQGLVASAVSHPLAIAKAFAWRLDQGDGDRQARALLRFLLQMQFLGGVEFSEVNLSQKDGPSDLVRVVVASVPGATKLYLWKPRNSALDLAILGASTNEQSDFPVFPSAVLQEAPENLTAYVTQIARERNEVIAQDGELRFRDPAQDLRFRGLVNRLATIVKAGAWKSALRAIALGAADASAFVVLPGLIPADANGLRWECPQHADQGRSWVDTCAGKEVTVSAIQPQLMCPVHHKALRDENGQVITVEKLGAALLRSAASRELIIWKDVERPPQATELRIDDRGISFAYWHANGPRVRLAGRVLTLADVLCRSHALPADAPSLPSHTLAVRPQYLGLLARYRWDPVEARWYAHLKGRPLEEKMNSPADPATGPNDGVVVWPTRVPGHKLTTGPTRVWNGDIVAAYLQYADQAAPVTRRTSSEGEPYLQVEEFSQMPILVASKEGATEFLALHTSGLDVGALPLERSMIETGDGKIGHVAIDFGTSNTVVAYCLDGEDEIAFVNQGVTNPKEQCTFVTSGPLFGKALDELLMVFSAWFPGESPMFGSLLLERKPSERGYVILPREPRLLKLVSGTDMQLHHELKWARPDEANEALLEKYLKRALIRAFHALREAGCGTINVAATYPLAFNPVRTGRFRTALAEAVKEASRIAGVTTGDALLLSESAAGIAMIPGETADYTLTIDLGGGTTDLAIVSNKGSEVHAVDSLKIGGRGLLQAVLGRANSDERRDIERSLQLGDMKVPPIVALESVLQSDPHQAQLGLTPATNQIRVRQSVAAMLAAIIVASVRLARTAVTRDDAIVNVVLLGQGWELLRRGVLGPIDEQVFFGALTAHSAAHFKLKRTSSMAGVQGKLALARGALRILSANASQQKLISGPVKLGMDLNGKNGTYEANGNISDIAKLDLATGDAGFAPIIDELVTVMTALSGPGHELGSVSAELDLRGPSGLSYRQDLINKGVHTLDFDFVRGGQLQSSPLMRFLDVCWQDHWTGQSDQTSSAV